MSDKYKNPHQNFPYLSGYGYLNGGEDDHGSIYCVTSPTGADIYLDGVLQSQHTNSTLTNVSQGNHTITFVLDGYISYTQTVSISKNRTITVFATLVPNFGSIYCATNPTGADIYLDGVLQSQHTNSTITNISPGSHTITLAKTGYISYAQTVNVIGGQTVTISAMLQTPPSGSLSIVADPSNANVYIDGVPQTQQTSSTITNILAGQHTITITKDGYLPYTQIVNIIANQTVNVCAILQQQLQGIGNLSIITDPTNANVYIDGVLNTQKTSLTITNISVGQHTVILTKAGYLSYTQNVNIIANQTITISAILQQLSTITDTEIVNCPTSAVSSCPTTPIPYTIISPLDYVNLMATINSTQAVSTTVRFTYIINDIVDYTDVTTNLTIGTNIVYAFPTNRTYPGGTILSIGDVILI